ncbi:MAG TPA: DNA methyltransferase, partial [Bacteroidia bacterium]|nr:DNA methyltransferase [Bacteroidia bacterium]
MSLELQEIIKKATIFSNDWIGATKENAEAQTFWNEFFAVFGLDRKKIAEFEKSVKKINHNNGRIDLFWKGKLIAEHKSKGEDLAEAKNQLNEYWVGLNKNDRPRFLIVSDFANIFVHDTDTHDEFKIKLKEFSANIHKFSFIYSDYKSDWSNEEKVNIRATKLMADLHDAFKASGYKGENLEKYLMRILFCLFAEDTNIFQQGLFQSYLIEHTQEDGSDVGSQLNTLFEILNIPEHKRQKNISDILKKFNYVNGSLYAENLPIAHFSKKQRAILLECCKFNWNEISPVIFGSMFQYVVDEKKRENVGAHYTSEKNILKAINGLFLDELHQEFDKVKYDEKKLSALHIKIGKLKFFDPACGCGNFLIIAYRQLRILEIEILKQIQSLNKGQIAIRNFLSSIHLDSFYGIEHEDFPAKVAETAMWLMEHKMNLKMLDVFGENVPTLPLKKTATIIHGNALRIEWNDIISKRDLSYIIGNPPFISKQDRNNEQKKDMDIIFKNSNGAGTLDYVCAWYIKTSDYIKDTNIKVAFVSTNSITQGEQIGVL